VRDSGGEDNQLACAHVACLSVSGERNPAAQAMDGDFTRCMVGRNDSPLGKTQSAELKSFGSHKRGRRRTWLRSAGTHINDFAELRLANGIPVDERLDVGNSDLDRRPMQRIGNRAEVGLQADAQSIGCLIRGFAANPHFGKALMMDVNPRCTASVAKVLRNDNRSWITIHKSPFPKSIVTLCTSAVVSLLDLCAEANVINLYEIGGVEVAGDFKAGLFGV
jgi:hypothetical protein